MILPLVLSRSSYKGRVISAARPRAVDAVREHVCVYASCTDDSEQPGKVGTGSLLFEITWIAIIVDGMTIERVHGS